MEVSASTERALEYIAQRANDVARAYSPGAVPNFDDVTTDRQEPRMTFDPLSIATPRDSYLISSGERGRTSYTQDGSLACKDGVIVGANGSAILGFGPDAPSALGAL